jgi:phosphoribosyl-AMP cyclohydrolase
MDCDADAVLLEVVQEGGACHEGYRSCFFRRLDERGAAVCSPRVFDPGDVYAP